MATYQSSLGHTVGAGSDYTYELPAITIPASERFVRCKIQKIGSYLSYCRMRGNAQTVLGQDGFDTWTTDKTAISWTNGGQPKVKIHNSGSTGYSWRIQVTIETEVIPDFTITCNSGTGGTMTASKAKASAGTVITLTPTPKTGYKLNKITSSPAVTISNNKFTMPAGNIVLTASWTKVNYAITKVTDPAGAGTITAPATAQYQDPVYLQQTEAEGYYFTGWTITPEINIEHDTFLMPAKAVTVTAHYLRRSTGTLSKSTLTGGEEAVLNINAEDSRFRHTWQLSFGENMETMETEAAAGVSSITISIPENWSSQIPNAVTKSGGSLTLKTYNGNTLIGTYTISGLVYAVPADALPEIGEILTNIVRTIGGTTYANIGEYYVQNHSGVRIRAEAEGVLGSTVLSMTAVVQGYTDTVEDDEIDCVSGLLPNAGETVITVIATDSRGRTATRTATITVQAYAPPAGTLHVWRVDQAGNQDDVNQWARYALTSQYSQIGSNSLARTLSCQGYSANAAQDTDDLLPGTGNRQVFLTTQEFTITLTLQDAFETTVITAKLLSAKFIIYAAADGDRIAFFKASSKPVPAGKDSVMEISAGTQVYIGDTKLEEIADGAIAAALGDAEDYADAAMAAALSDAEDYADGAADQAELNAKDYTDARLTATEIEDPVNWDSTYVTVASCAAKMYAIGDIRILTLGIYLKSAISSATVIGTVKAGHRPAYQYIIAAAVTPQTSSSQNAKMAQVRSSGEIRMNYANASTSAAGVYHVTFIYTV